MTHLITQACCNEGSCVRVCPVGCIRPTPDDPAFMHAEMLHIDPSTCIDCGACVPECPVDAIKPDHEVDDDALLEINSSYFRKHPIVDTTIPKPPKRERAADFSSLRVAIIGSGPSAHYAARSILAQPGAEVDMFERLPVPYGLIRSGVAPDHQSTKRVTNTFRSLHKKRGFGLHLGVEVGKHVSHEELVEHYTAVIYAVGASSDRKLGIPGEHLDGSHSATGFVAWYNGHPDHTNRAFDLNCERAVIVGNGNVALDMARMLLTDPETLARTDIADHALEALRSNNIREVVILGRRGPAQAAYTNTEFLELTRLPGVDLVVNADEATLDAETTRRLQSDELDPSMSLKAELAARAAQTPANGSSKRIVLRFCASPIEILGDSKVRAITVARNELGVDDAGDLRATATNEVYTIEAGLVLRSVGYQGIRLDTLPFDEQRGIIPNNAGRVVEPTSGDPIAGVYTTGWIKRGPTGGIGVNKRCAESTVELLLDDFENGKLPAPIHDAGRLRSLVRDRQPHVLDAQGWLAIDKAERSAGASNGRPRVKFTDLDGFISAGTGVD